MAHAYINQDLQITDDGDLVLTAGGDLKVASIDQTSKQDVVLNLYTILGDMGALPFIGSRVIDFIGEPNSRQNAQLLQSEMLRALTVNQRFFTNDVSIRIVPTDIDAIACYITIQNLASQSPQTIVFDFNYIHGLQLLSTLQG